MTSIKEQTVCTTGQVVSTTIISMNRKATKFDVLCGPIAEDVAGGVGHYPILSPVEARSHVSI